MDLMGSITHKLRYWVLMSGLLICCQAMATTAKLTQFRLSHLGQSTRLVFEFNHKTNYKIFTLRKPDRLVIDFSDTKLTAGNLHHAIKETLLRDLRTGIHHHTGLRVVVDLKQQVKHKEFWLNPENAKPFRFVLDLTASVVAKVKTRAKIKPKYTPEPKLSVKTRTITTTITPTNITTATPVIDTKTDRLAAFIAKQMTKEQQMPTPKVHLAVAKQPVNASSPKQVPIVVSEVKPVKRKIIIVIDPGHGGKDSGAIGPRGVMEKTVVLAISKDLQRDLNRERGFHAYLTRKGDYYIGLRQRLSIARRDKADMFIAVHADAFKNRSARGGSVFALSQRGATSEAARWLAQRENASELAGVKEFVSYDRTLRSVLIDLSQTATISASLQIGTSVLHQMSRVTHLHNRRVEQAAFVVLKSPDIPSILVETGFISNPREERQLRNPRYQSRLANAIMKGIKNYYMHTTFGRRIFGGNPKNHIVARGDSLTSIAEQYNISVASLRRLNHMGRRSSLKIGQRIRIY